MSKRNSEIVVICHNIRSRHNVGAIFRTADGAGVDKIYLCGITPAPPHSRIEKVSLGAENFVAWEQYACDKGEIKETIEKGNESALGEKETLSVIKKLKKDGFKILALEQTENSIPYNEFKSDGSPVALIVGYEVEGLSENILKECDTVLEIPMLGQKKSLNVSVAFGVAIYRLRDLMSNLKNILS